MPRLSVSVPYETGPARWTGPALLPPSRIVLGGADISSPAHSANAASHSGAAVAPVSMRITKLNVWWITAAPPPPARRRPSTSRTVMNSSGRDGATRTSTTNRPASTASGGFTVSPVETSNASAGTAPANAPRWYMLGEQPLEAHPDEPLQLAVVGLEHDAVAVAAGQPPQQHDQPAHVDRADGGVVGHRRRASGP